MALNLDYEGRSYPAGPVYEVGVEKLREFARAIGDTNPAYHDAAAARALGHADVLAPPTFVMIITMAATGAVIGDPGLGLDYTRVVHGEQRFAYTRPLMAGDKVRVVVTLESLRVAAGNDMVTARSDVTDEHGEHVVTTWGTLVARGTATSQEQS
ncbi:MAG TPA: MaoC family dehydratase N-terminal domain-containing protein [Candidatus Nanopelagicales bacterium]